MITRKSNKRLISVASNYLDRLGAKRVSFYGSRNSFMAVGQVQLNFLRFSCNVKKRAGSLKETGSMIINQGKDMSNYAGKIVPQVLIIRPKWLTVWTEISDFQGNIFWSLKRKQAI